MREWVWKMQKDFDFQRKFSLWEGRKLGSVLEIVVLFLLFTRHKLSDKFQACLD